MLGVEGGEPCQDKAWQDAAASWMEWNDKIAREGDGTWTTSISLDALVGRGRLLS